MNKPDIATIIDLHFEELTELEQEIARYFLQAETIQDDLSSQQVTQKLHISQAALTRFSKKCGFTGYREFVFQYQHQASKPDTHSHKHSPLTKRVLRSYSIMREQTQDLIDEEQLERVAQLIDDAERVYFFGTGSSGLIAREMKLRFMRLGVVCEALTDQDGFAWTTSIMDENCLVLGFSLSGTTQSVLDSLLDAKEMGAKTILFTSAPNKNSQAYNETVLVASHSQSSYIQRISAQLPMLILIDLIYAYFLEINRESKEKIFNSYWENKKLNGYRRQKRVRKS
ncbi:MULTISPECIES: MurR/RpiR family transcriptional regulator [Streptococcus]|jgi:putative HTH-type transcriptional regulator yfhH|uniref:MurR/RpiR family transcriptional regulator n=2 Tax=Streptococcus oralis TaxID=1303 RepID=A0A0F2DCS0_STROR|nr:MULTISPECIES: MurR/RpiR family transcriptional regulator [Streptococcus]KEQ46822.1 helix-turn-helix domain, rpiR family protein [Streptococcus oralis]KJQ67780.1 phosphosugar-binding transcriptional regulator [Streptococcus oralis subsp. oralis]KJQ71197.1 phosphosugar-binding transcriptional regulator [Streptococcus oralis subsp. oralis]MBR8666811.1 MurR/RpiR family transcriptional regulator [Streptococcus oralis]MBS9406556.1 MurR/RpiR family transcriptional regulator [Streptococcus oralis]